MRRHLVLLLLVLPFGLTFARPTVAAAADPATVVRSEQFATPLNTCTGEGPITLQGFFIVVIQDNGDGTQRVRSHVHATGAGDLGDPTSYVYNQVRTSTCVGGALEVKVDARDVLVSLGSKPNQIVRFQFDAATGLFDLHIVCTG